jgi:hypothetical protein
MKIFIVGIQYNTPHPRTGNTIYVPHRSIKQHQDKESLSKQPKHHNDHNNNNDNNNNNQSVMQETYIQLQQVSSEKIGSKMHPSTRNIKIRRRTITSNTSIKKTNKFLIAYAAILVSEILP